MKNWEALATDESIQKASDSLISEGIEVILAASGEEAKAKVLEMIPKGAEVMTASSETLNTIGITSEINDIGNYNSVKSKLKSMDRATQGREMAKLGSAPDFVVGSAHAVSEDGHIFVASKTGSQLTSYAFSAGKVILVVGTQKIVKDWDEGKKRVYEYSLPREDERAQKAGIGPSFVGKLLVINKEFKEGRIVVIFVKERLGF